MEYLFIKSQILEQTKCTSFRGKFRNCL